MKLKPAGVNPDGTRKWKIDGLPGQKHVGFPKQIQGLRKRKGAIGFARTARELDDFGPAKVGDEVWVEHEQLNGVVTRIRIHVDALQPEDAFIGEVVALDPALQQVPGIAMGDEVVTHMDFVYQVIRSNG